MNNYKNKNLIFSFFLIFLLSLSLLSCHKDISDYESILNQVDLPQTLMKGDKLLVSKEIEGYPITWSVDKLDYFDEAGLVVKAPKSDVKVNVSIFVNSNFAGYKTVTILQDMDLYFSTIEEYVRSSIKPRVNSNIRFRYDYYESEDVVITYQSSKPSLIQNDGTYLKHEYDEEVDIFVKIVARGFDYEFVVNVVAIGIPDSEKIVKVDAWLRNYFDTNPLTNEMELPITHPNYGGSIRWVAEDPYLILNNKDLLLPDEAGRYYFLAEINFTSAIEQRNYLVNLEKGPSLTTKEKAIRFIQTSVTKDFEHTLVLYEGKESTVIKNIIDTTTVKHKLHFGDKPVVPQAELNKRVYDGYQMTNPQNILWIVVHETGSRLLGKYATVFDQLQRNRAYNDSKPDADASWHYTVDDHEIIQNYSDHIACWHAGDGSQIGGGNQNGIGIELCINPDGNYHIAMRNDARLIAGLMHKYNLNMLNIKRHRDFMVKDCPETMIRDRLWFLFLDLIAKEYISQDLLPQFEVSYDIETTSSISQWVLDDIFYLNEKKVETKNILVNVTIDDFVFNFTTTIKP